MTYCAESTARETIAELDKIEIPEGYEHNGDKCYKLDEFKLVAKMIAGYKSCELQREIIFSMFDDLDSKYLLLQEAADDLSIELEDLHYEREALIVRSLEHENEANNEKQKAKIWRAFAIGGGVVSVALGVVVGLLAR